MYGFQFPPFLGIKFACLGTNALFCIRNIKKNFPRMNLLKKCCGNTQATKFVCFKSFSSTADNSHTMDSMSSNFRDLVFNRSSVSSFDPHRKIPSNVLQDILETTLRSPSSFNIQPYSCILVEQETNRKKLSKGMLGHNAKKVLDSPVVAIFLADLEPDKRVPHLQKILYDHDSSSPASIENIAKLPSNLQLFAGQGAIGGAIRCGVSSMSPLMAVPSYVPTIAWSFKNTMIAASTFMFALQSHNISSCPMEGFDEKRIKQFFDIPDRYSIPVIIAAGYSKENAETAANRSPRFALSDVFFNESFGESVDK